ncbi:hypothetical protein EDD15DRAFT_1726749 [Pisolithus albus]|nr:hypothetical protein EDD15DRAFT_1726749 [Pisolithus albus]
MICYSYYSCGMTSQGRELCNSWIDCTSAPEVSSCLMASFVLSDDRFTQTNIAILTDCMRFQIPTYNVHLKVDMHLRNKDEYGSDRDDAAVRAHGRFIADTRANIKKNFKEGGLPDQRIHTVSNRTLPSIVKDHSPRFPTKDVLALVRSQHRR